MPPHLGHHTQISHTTREQIGPTCARRDRHTHAMPYLAGACSSFSQASHRLRRIASAAPEGGRACTRWCYSPGPFAMLSKLLGKHAGRVRITPRWLHFLRVSRRYPELVQLGFGLRKWKRRSAPDKLCGGMR